LIKKQIWRRFWNEQIDRMDDSAVLPVLPGRTAFTTDSYTVSPLEFPGGNIGDLAICGTVNDLAMSGAAPHFLSLSLILEEGLPIQTLESVLDAAYHRAQEAGVMVVCGDTKVVDRGKADGLYINTAGIGILDEGVDTGSGRARPGDVLIVSGPLGLHGLAVMLTRGDFEFETPLLSDVAPLNHVVRELVTAEDVQVRCLRDLTRGGLAMALGDVTARSGVSIEIRQTALPKTEAADAACELLGLDPLYIACEGTFLAVVPPEHADRAVKIMHARPESEHAAVVGTVREKGTAAIELATAIGSRRVVSLPSGEQMPRIC
jgi:hydrogenase expression/formation protein HypE